MKLAKALKEKNRLVGEINRLKNLIERENSRDVRSTSKVDCGKLWPEMISATEKLINLKSKIFKANIGIYEKIVRMGELKLQLSWLESVNTRDYKTETPDRNGVVIVTEVKAWMNQEKADAKKLDLQNEISLLQDQIDEYNATVEV